MSRLAAGNKRLMVGGKPILSGTSVFVQRWYVSATATAGDGTRSNPWPLSYAASGGGGQITPGSMVLLRGGTYQSVTGWTFSLSGATSNPISFRNYPGETVILDGAIRAFVDTPATAWEEYGAQSDGHRVFRSTGTHPVSGGTHYVGFFEIAGQVYTLAAHKDGATYGIGNLVSDFHNYRSPAAGTTFDPALHGYYLGPGIAYNPADQKIYIRLDNSTSTAQCGRAVTQVTNFDPRTQSVYLSQENRYALNISGDHLRFEGLQIDNFFGWANHTGGTDQVDTTFVRCSGRVGMYGMRLGYTDGVLIDSCIIRGHMPSQQWWISWNDVKGGAYLNADHVRKCAIVGDLGQNVEISNTYFDQFFDGILVSGSAIVSGWNVHHNVFDHIWDDGWQMYGNLENTEIHHNLFLGAAWSNDESGSTLTLANPGTVFIYDNIVDTTQNKVFWGRKGRTDYEGEFESNPHATHGKPSDASHNAACRKIYNNTIVSGHGPGVGAVRYNEATGVPTTLQSSSGFYIGVGIFGDSDAAWQGEPHEVYNNVFAIRDGRPLAERVITHNGREIYDGNVYWFYGDHPESPDFRSPYRCIWLFVETSTTTKNGQLVPYTDSHSDVRAVANAVTDSQVYYAPGWDAASLTIDPDLNGSYVPQATEALTEGVDLSSTGWPGTTAARTRRGAALSLASLPTG